MNYLIVALGGAIGSLGRYILSGFTQGFMPTFFPVGTLTVNTIGCFFVGITGAAFFGPFLVRDEYRLALMVGFLGGFTTFSAFGWETLSMLNDGDILKALANIACNNTFGMIAAWGGYNLTKSIIGA